VHKQEQRKKNKLRSFMSYSEPTSKSFSQPSPTSDQVKSNRSEKLSDPSSLSLSFPKIPSSRKSLKWELAASKKNNSDTCSNNSEESFPNSKLLPHYSNKKSLLFLLMPQSMNLEAKLRLTRSQLKQELVLLPLLIFQFPLDLLGLIPHKSTFSMPWISQPRSLRVKFKSPRTSRFVLRTKKSKLQKLPFSRSSTSNHLNMVWK